jgi:hypothetical protein
MFVRYKNFWFRVIASLLAAHFIVLFGVVETFFQLLCDPVYYIALAGSFLIALLLVNYIHFITIRLDKHYDWQVKPIERTALQFFFGFVLTGILAFLLALAYFSTQGVQILKTPYLRFDYPIILVLLFFTNLYYLGHYIYLQWRMEKNAVVNTPIIEATTSQEPEGKKSFMVNQGAKNIPIPLDQIAYFYRDEATFLRTFNEEDYVIPQPLDEVQQYLNEKDFFRANRQMLVNRNACKHFESLPHNKLELFTQPKYKQQIVISQLRNRNFKDWMEG